MSDIFVIDINDEIIENCRKICAEYLGDCWMNLSAEEFDCQPIQ